VKSKPRYSSMKVALGVSAAIPLVALLACGSDAPSGVAPPPVGVGSAVHLASDPGESLAAGATYDYSTANALVTVRPFGTQLSMRVVGDRVWDGYLSISGGTQLRTGTFTDLSNTPLPGGSGFRWSSQERTCVSSVASVTIDTVHYDGDALRAIDLHFEQRCDGQSAALRGTVRWRASDDPMASGPVQPVPAALWRAPAGSTPTIGSYVYLEGNSPLSPDITLPQTLVPVPGRMQVRTLDGTLSILAFDPSTALTMIGTFKLMGGQTAVQDGYYKDLRSPIEGGRGAAGLDVALNAWDCISPVGWFAIDHQFYFQGNLTTVDLRFELRCSGFDAPLRGQVHWAE
jgi:hypothetical protein